MKDLLEKTSHIRLLISDVIGELADGSLERHSRLRGTIVGNNDGK